MRVAMRRVLYVLLLPPLAALGVIACCDHKVLLRIEYPVDGSSSRTDPRLWCDMELRDLPAR